MSSRNLAILQTIVATFRLNDVLPFEYITDVVVRVETHPAKKLDDLLPMNWRPVAQQGSTRGNFRTMTRKTFRTSHSVQARFGALPARVAWPQSWDLTCAEGRRNLLVMSPTRMRSNSTVHVRSPSSSWHRYGRGMSTAVANSAWLMLT